MTIITKFCNQATQFPIILSDASTQTGKPCFSFSFFRCSVLNHFISDPPIPAFQDNANIQGKPFNLSEVFIDRPLRSAINRLLADRAKNIYGHERITAIF